MGKVIDTPATDLNKLQKQSSGDSDMKGCVYADSDVSGFKLVIGLREGESVLLDELSK